MKMTKKVTRLCILLSISLCLIGIITGLLIWRGDWRFYISQTIRFYGDPALEPATDIQEGREWMIKELKAADNVTVLPTLMLINEAHPIPEGYVAELEEYNGARMHPSMVSAYIALRDSMQERTDERIYISSDYRTREEQESLLHDEDAYEVAASVGCSEHEAGLALDVYVRGFGGYSFLKTETGREVNRVCGEYGFIIRYPLWKEEITGIPFEPWHLRYVGAPHAQIIMDAGLTLEEYLALLTPETWFASGSYRILRTRAETVTLPDGWETCEISEDNTGYTVITLKMA